MLEAKAVNEREIRGGFREDKTSMQQPSVCLPLGIVIRRVPGKTRWVRHVWKAVDLLPGAGPAAWKVLREEGEAVEYHAATVTLELWRTDTEAYLSALSARVPSIGVIMSNDPDRPQVLLATASPYETQDYLDSGEELVELVPMPEGLVALIRDFVEEHHTEEAFVKRRRDRERTDRKVDGVGDARIPQLTDVYRSPTSRKAGRLH